MKGYPRWFSRTFITLIMLLVSLSGCLLVPSLLEMRLEWEEIWTPLKDYRTLVVATHTLSGILIMMVLGALWSIHMRVGWRAKEKRTSGSLSVLAFLLVAISSIGILYFGDEMLSLGSSLVHTALGLAVIPVFAIHLRQPHKSA